MMTTAEQSQRNVTDMQSSLTNEISLLNRIRVFNEHVIETVAAFVCNKDLRSLTRDYEACLQKRDVDLSFNLFDIVSRLYYRENFHSDILRALLDPKGKHQQQEKHLHSFLEFIQSHGAAVNLSSYMNARVTREEGRIDLLIKDDVSKKAIILENKINGAGDMPQQIPRYLEYVRANDYTCEAVIYLRLNGSKGPDTTGWTDREKEDVKRLLKVICAYDETDRDLLNGWIHKCETRSENPDAKHILKQYGDLITRLGGNIMNKPIIEKFYNLMVKDDNLKIAQSLRAMLDDLLLFRVERIIDEFKNNLHPFQKIGNYQDNDAYFIDCYLGEAHLGLDIFVETEHYVFSFWDRNDRTGTKNRARCALEKMNCVNEYILSGGSFQKTFKFPSQEAELFEHIRVFKSKLGEMLKAETTGTTS